MMVITMRMKLDEVSNSQPYVIKDDAEVQTEPNA
jgi:hypothetical protein